MACGEISISPYYCQRNYRSNVPLSIVPLSMQILSRELFNEFSTPTNAWPSVLLEGEDYYLKVSIKDVVKLRGGAVQREANPTD